MEYLLLGLLILSPMTGYGLQQFIRKNLSLICSHSAGSVQTALTKLEQAHLVRAESSAQGRRRKKTFFITEQGRAAFSGWVAQPMRADRIKNMELSRLFFLGLARPAERAAAIRDYIAQISQLKAVLCEIRAQFDAISKSSLPGHPEWDAVFRFQGYTIDYGIAAAAFELDWYDALLNKMEEDA